MNTQISTNPRLMRKIVKQTKNKKSHIEGYFAYDYGFIAVNLNCKTFKKNSFNKFVSEFTRILTHEVLHFLIYEETNTVATQYEEEIIDAITRG